MSYSARWPESRSTRCFADRNYARAARTPLDPDTRHPAPACHTSHHPPTPPSAADTGHRPPPAPATLRRPHQPPSAADTGHRPGSAPATVRDPYRPRPAAQHAARPPMLATGRPRTRAPAPATLRPRRSLPPRTPRARPSTHQQSPPGALLAAAQRLPRRAARAAPADGPPGRRQPGCPRCSADHSRPVRTRAAVPPPLRQAGDPTARITDKR